MCLAFVFNTELSKQLLLVVLLMCIFGEVKKSTPIKYEVPADGSLALLALGAVGIRAWREKLKREKEQGDGKN